MKVKDAVYQYIINLDFKANTVKQSQNSHIVIGYNKTNLAIDDLNFSTIRHTKMYQGDTTKLFNEVEIFDFTFAGCDEIRATLNTQTSSPKIAYKRMKKALEKFIYAKHGRYCNAITFLDQIKI